MKKQILKIVNEKHNLSGGSCGIYFTEFLILLKIDYPEFKTIMSEMNKNKEISIRKSINGWMVMKITQQ